MTDTIAAHLVTLGQRIKKYRAQTGLSQTAFGSVGGVSITTQQQYEAGKTAPTAEYLFRLREHGADLTMLLTNDTTAELSSAVSMLPPDLAKFARSKTASALPTADPDVEMVEVQQIDLDYGFERNFTDGTVAVQMHRFPRAWLESITHTPPSLLTFAHSRGDSMQPTIQDGDMVLIDRSQRMVREWDAIWAITIGEMAMIKRLRVRGERVHIISDNERVPADDIFHKEINIFGRIIFIGRRI